MSESDVLFDTWAWWEYLHGTPVGASLRRRFLSGGGARVHTSAISLAELAAKLSTSGGEGRVAAACGVIRRASHVWDVTADIAIEGGLAREELRRGWASASLADGIIAATAKRAGSRIVSADPAFRGTPGVVAG